MDDLTTPQGIDAVLAATASYDVMGDLSLAQRRVAALRRKLDMPQSAGRGDQTMAYFLQATQNELDSCLAFCRANMVPTEQQKLNDPGVLHADFQTFGKYRLGGNHYGAVCE